MNTHNMTPAQLRALADQIEQENHRPTYVGYLKHDLYECSHSGKLLIETPDEFWLFTKKQKDSFLNKEMLKLKESFNIALKKGTKFNCYYIDGAYLWYDGLNYGVEDMMDDWAQEHLENITEC